MTHTIESARDRLRNMGMKDGKFGESEIDLNSCQIGLGGWSAIEFLRGRGVRITVIGNKSLGTTAKEEEKWTKSKVILCKKDNKCIKYAC